VTIDTKDDIVQYDVIEMEESKNEEISEPYYSEITHNKNNNSGYIMKPNICYSTSQITNATIDISVSWSIIGKRVHHIETFS
jgi:hypothetical protein